MSLWQAIVLIIAHVNKHLTAVKNKKFDCCYFYIVYSFFLFFQVLKSRGYRNVVLQIGRGSFEPESIHEDNFNLTYFRFKDSIVHDVSHADLVICHAGKSFIKKCLNWICVRSVMWKIQCLSVDFISGINFTKSLVTYSIDN